MQNGITGIPKHGLSDKSGVTLLTCMAIFAAERYFAV
jgi:hypothetical protein